jgi:hypothetical protein
MYCAEDDDYEVDLEQESDEDDYGTSYGAHPILFKYFV